MLEFQKTIQFCGDSFCDCEEGYLSTLSKLLDAKIVTKGKQGATYKGNTYNAPIVEVHDVCGAGDTFLSVLAYSYLNCNNIEQAIMHANNAAALSVQHSGVYVLTQEDLKQI